MDERAAHEVAKGGIEDEHYKSNNNRAMVLRDIGLRTIWRHRVSTWLEYIIKRFNDDTNRGNHIPVKHIKGGDET